MNRLILPVVLIIALLQGLVLFLLARDVDYLKRQATDLPAKIDLLVSSSDKVINLDCPECPECPPCKDYTPDFDKLRKQLKQTNAPQGYYYYYGGCR